MSLIIKTTSTLFSTKYELYIDVDERYPNYYADGFSNRSQVESAISAVENAKNKVKQTLTGTDYDKIKTLHDWIVDYMYNDSSSAHKASVYGAFAEKKGVCEAYARVFKYILDDTGIENILVTGKGQLTIAREISFHKKISGLIDISVFPFSAGQSLYGSRKHFSSADL